MRYVLTSILGLFFLPGTMFSQTNENKPINPETIRFYSGESTLISDNVYDCYKVSSGSSVFVKAQVTEEMFNYDLVILRIRISSEAEQSVSYSKSDFKNKFEVGSELTLELTYDNFCMDYYTVESNIYYVEVVGANITSYDQQWNQWTGAYESIPVYGEYDFLSRSNSFKYIVNQKEAQRIHDEREAQLAEEERKDRRRTVITYSVVGGGLVLLLLYLYL